LGTKVYNLTEIDFIIHIFFNENMI